MKRLMALILFSVSAGMAMAGPLDDAACPIQGDRFAWTTDYCLALNDTDDEMLAGSCIDQELQRRFVNACEAVTFYKQAMCGLAIERGRHAGRIDDCVAEAGFLGPTVRRKAADTATKPAS